MAIYHYTHPLIEQVEVTAPHPGLVQASILAHAHADTTQLEQLRLQLAGQSVTTLMDSENGRPVLRVRGLKNEQQLTEALQKAGLGQHSDKSLTDEDKHRKKPGFTDKIRNNSLQLSALFYDLGNIAYFVSGVQRGRHNKTGRMIPQDKSEFMTGAAFGLGDVLMTIYSGKKGDEQLQATANSLAHHLRSKGIEIPKGDALNPDSLHQSGAVEEINNWMRRHIIHMKSLTEMTGGLLTIHAGMKRDRHGKLNEGKITSGILLTGGWLTTLLLDKSHLPPQLESNQSGSGGLIDKMTDNPRGLVTRPLSIANNVANLWGALGPKTGERTRFREHVEEAQKAFTQNPSAKNKAELERNIAKQHDYKWNVLTQSSFIVAHTLFGMSGSKRPEETRDDKEVMDDLVLVSANMLAAQPERMRAQAVEETADYIAKMAHVAEGRQDIVAAINDKINGLTRSGWVARQQQEVSTGPQISS